MADLIGVDLARPGTWHLSNGKRTFTPEMLRDAADFFAATGGQRIPLGFGHLDARFDGDPAFGWLANVRYEEDDSGPVLRGDLVDLDDWVAAAAPKRWPNRSIEGVMGVTFNGREYGLALTRLALLGATPPGIPVLKSLMDVRQLVAASVAACGGEWIAASATEVPLFDLDTEVVMAHVSHNQKSHGNRVGKPDNIATKTGVGAGKPPRKKPSSKESATEEKPKVQIPHRADGKAKRGDIMVVERTDSSYSVSKGREESKSYRVYEVTSVSRDGEPLKVRDLQGYNGRPRGEETTRTGYGKSQRPAYGFTGRKQIIPGDQVDTVGLSKRLNERTYPNTDTPRAHESLKELGDAIRPHLVESGAKPTDLGPDPDKQLQAVQNRIKDAGDIHAQWQQLEKELSKPDLLPETRTKLEKVKAENAERVAAAKRLADPDVSADPVQSRVDRIGALGPFQGGRINDILEGASRDELEAIGKQFGVPVDDLRMHRPKFARNELANRIRQRPRKARAVAASAPDAHDDVDVVDSLDGLDLFEDDVDTESSPDEGVAPDEGEYQPSTREGAAGMSLDAAMLREALGIDPDASDDEVRTALTSAGFVAHQPNPPEPHPAPNPTPAPAPKPEAELALASSAPGTIVLASSVYEEMQKTIKGLTSFVEKSKRDERDTVIAKAVEQGRFTPAQKPHFARLWDADPDGTRKLIDNLVPNSQLAVMASGYDGDSDEAIDREYSHLFPPKTGGRRG